MAAGIGREYFDRSIRLPRQIERDLGLRYLGSLPLVASRSGLKSNTFGGLLASADWMAITGETLRRARMSADDVSRSTGGAAIGIISPHRGDGRTTVALSLAALPSRDGKRLLLIDGDLRRPRLTEGLGADARHQLITALAGQPAPDGAARSDLPFDFLGHAPGSTASHPADVLGSQAMQDLLSRHRKTHDTILIDLPPVIGHVDAEAAAGQFDAFILVVQWGRTTLEDVQRVLTSDAIAERISGVLIVKSRPAVSATPTRATA
jgi:succinoglycan biosynthesis transport protein ExoP